MQRAILKSYQVVLYPSGNLEIYLGQHIVEYLQLTQWVLSRSKDIRFVKLYDRSCVNNFCEIFNFVSNLKFVKSISISLYSSSIDACVPLLDTGNIQTLFIDRVMPGLRKSCLKLLAPKPALRFISIESAPVCDEVTLVDRINNSRGSVVLPDTCRYRHVAYLLRCNRALRNNFLSVKAMVYLVLKKFLPKDIVLYILLPMLAANDWTVSVVKKPKKAVEMVREYRAQTKIKLRLQSIDREKQKLTGRVKRMREELAKLDDEKKCLTKKIKV